MDKYIISENESILNAMKKIDANGKGIVFICRQKKLHAVITDGDIRRYIIKNGDVNKDISEVWNETPKYLYLNDNKDYNMFMCEKQITAVPILNQQNEIVRIEFCNNFKVYNNIELNLPVVIMAGGKGTRLSPYTQILPKPLIPVGEKTILEHIIDRFSHYGCHSFYIIVNYKKELIKAYFSEVKREEKIIFVDEDKFMGTGGGLKLLEDTIKETFIMTNCDILIEEDYGQILKYHKKNKNIVTMICAMKNITIPYGTIKLSNEGTVEEIKEKPNFSFMTNTGMYILEPKFLKWIPNDTFIHMTDLIQECIAGGEEIGVYPIAESAWLDMGQIEELENMKTRLEKI